MTTLSLLHGDCLEVMKTLPDKSVDLFLCDLPYGCLTGGGGQEKKRRKAKGSTDSIAGCSWDVKINLDLFWKQVERLMKHDRVPVIQFCTIRFGMELIQSKPKWFRYDMVWEKGNAVGFLLANKQPLRAHENIFIFSKKGAYYERKDIEGDFKRRGGGRSTTNCYSFGEYEHLQPDNEGKRCLRSVMKVGTPKIKGQHPTQKPMELYKMLIERYCPDGGTVLDPTAGSFTSCFAAQELGRNAIGIELNEDFYNKARRAAGEPDIIEHA
jgi:site-specific DNA-methyltransferase (adenine-specific)